MRILLRAIGEGKANAPDQILARWTWKLARATRKVQDRRASAEFPEAKRLLGAVANSRGHRHEDNVAKLVQVARALPLAVGAALLASADGYTPRANALLDQAREDLGADPGDRERAGREPARAEGSRSQVAAQAQEAPAGRRCSGWPGGALGAGGVGGRPGRSDRDRSGERRRPCRSTCSGHPGRERGVGRPGIPGSARRPA